MAEEKEDENIYDQIRREQREKQEAEAERKRNARERFEKNSVGERFK